MIKEGSKFLSNEKRALIQLQWIFAELYIIMFVNNIIVAVVRVQIFNLVYVYMNIKCYDFH